MSRVMRISALAVFVGALAWEPAPVRGGSCDCEWTGTNDPFVYFLCSDCFAGQICAEQFLCHYIACQPYEAGANVTLMC